MALQSPMDRTSSKSYTGDIIIDLVCNMLNCSIESCAFSGVHMILPYFAHACSVSHFLFLITYFRFWVYHNPIFKHAQIHPDPWVWSRNALTHIYIIAQIILPYQSYSYSAHLSQKVVCGSETT